MPGKRPLLSPLESRKQLLLAESELNRAQFLADLTALQAGMHKLTDRARSMGTMATSAVSLIAGLASLRRVTSGNSEYKRSWLRTLLRGVGVASTLWTVWRQQRVRRQ